MLLLGLVREIAVLTEDVVLNGKDQRAVEITPSLFEGGNTRAFLSSAIHSGESIASGHYRAVICYGGVDLLADDASNISIISNQFAGSSSRLASVLLYRAPLVKETLALQRKDLEDSGIQNLVKFHRVSGQLFLN